MIIPTTYECIFCGNESNLKTSNCPGYQRGMKFNIFYCKFCDTSSALPYVNTNTIYDIIYQRGKDVPGYNRYWNYAENIIKKKEPLFYLSSLESTYWGVQEALKKIVHDKKNNKILEIGSGRGYLTYALYKEGYDIQGLDISNYVVEQANNNFGNLYICEDVFNYSSTNPQSCDIIILTEVIEHVENPINFIKNLLKILKPNGSIILTTPNRSIYPQNTLWATELPPIHYWWLSEKTIKTLSEKLSLNFTFIDFTNYYKYKYQSIKIYNPDFITNKTILDESGQIILKVKDRSEFIFKLKDLLLKSRKIKNKVLYFFDLFNKKKFVCSKKGNAMCVILQNT